ncbi:MAG: hypothetical protein M3Q36_00065 [bacterium]|nr:hypothetical protein [bacterium]
MAATEFYDSPLEKLIGLRDGELDPSIPENVPDIAIDGGGMKSIIAVGALKELHEEGLLQQAPRITAISGGTPAATAAMTGQFCEIQQTFEYDLPESKFIDFSRLFKGKPVVQLPILEQTLRSGLDTKAVIDSSQELVFGVTRLSEGLEPQTVSTRDIKEDELVSWIMRGMHMPRVAGRPTPDKSGDVYVDGGLSWLTTPELAFSLGANSVLNISNVPPKKWQVDKAQTDFVGRWLNKMGAPNCAEMYRNFAIRQMYIINQGFPSNVQIISPSANSELPGTLETSPRKIHAGFIAGQNAVRAALQRTLIEVPQRPQPNKSIVVQASRQIAQFVGPRALSAAFTLIP